LIVPQKSILCKEELGEKEIEEKNKMEIESTMYKKNSHCSFCGTKFPDGFHFPFTCANCSQITYSNPIPVTVLLVPVEKGILVVRRGIEPAKGQLALPGGFIETGETWQEAGVRELREEADVSISPDSVKEFMVQSANENRLVLIFGVTRELKKEELTPFIPNAETLERKIIYAYEELAFELHSLALSKWFQK